MGGNHANSGKTIQQLQQHEFIRLLNVAKHLRIAFRVAANLDIITCNMAFTIIQMVLQMLFVEYRILFSFDTTRLICQGSRNYTTCQHHRQHRRQYLAHVVVLRPEHCPSCILYAADRRAVNVRGYFYMCVPQPHTPGGMKKSPANGGLGDMMRITAPVPCAYSRRCSASRGRPAPAPRHP